MGLLAGPWVYGQLSIERQVVAASGGLGSAGTLTVSSTAGEPTTTTLIAGTLVLTQGFQQDGAGTSDAITSGLSVAYRIFPNPTTDLLAVELVSPAHMQVRVSLCDAAGRVLESIVIAGAGTQVAQFSLYPYADGWYLISLADMQNEQLATARVRKE
ncbi:MAG: hypothetical protein OHK0039_26660 [Bacteroidia bacterium]